MVCSQHRAVGGIGGTPSARFTESIVARLSESSVAWRAFASSAAVSRMMESPATAIFLVAESAFAVAPHTLPMPCVTRSGVSTSTDVSRDGLTAGRIRYVRVQTSDVFSSVMIDPIVMPRGNVPPSPDV